MALGILGLAFAVFLKHRRGNLQHKLPKTATGGQCRRHLFSLTQHEDFESSMMQLQIRHPGHKSHANLFMLLKQSSCPEYRVEFEVEIGTLVGEEDLDGYTKVGRLLAGRSWPFCPHKLVTTLL